MPLSKFFRSVSCAVNVSNSDVCIGFREPHVVIPGSLFSFYIQNAVLFHGTLLPVTERYVYDQWPIADILSVKP